MKHKSRGRPPVKEITDSQLNTLKAIRRFTNQRGFPPTMKELADILGISHASAHGQVNQLVRKGYLRREPRKARGLAIIREPEDEVSDMVPIPIIGEVAAGQPIFAHESIIGEVLIEGRLARSGRCFALEIKGDSMIDAGINAVEVKYEARRSWRRTRWRSQPRDWPQGSSQKRGPIRAAETPGRADAGGQLRTDRGTARPKRRAGLRSPAH